MAGYKKKGPTRKQKRSRKAWAGGDRHYHAKQRARKHYGLILYNDDMESMIYLIKAGQGEYLKQSHVGEDRHIYIVRYRDTNFVVVYDKPERVIVTVLPPEVASEV